MFVEYFFKDVCVYGCVVVDYVVLCILCFEFLECRSVVSVS